MSELYNNVRSTLESQRFSFVNSQGHTVTGSFAPEAVLQFGIDQAGNLAPIKAGQGAPNVATNQVATSTTAATLVAARATRRSVTVRNLDAAVNVFVGPATVTASNGYRLGPGQEATFYTTALLQVISASVTPTVAYVEYYD